MADMYIVERTYIDSKGNACRVAFISSAPDQAIKSAVQRQSDSPIDANTVTAKQVDSISKAEKGDFLSSLPINIKTTKGGK